MSATKARRLVGVAALALASALAVAAPVPASAAPPVFTPEQDFVSDYTAGTACDFELLMKGSESEKTEKRLPTKAVIRGFLRQVRDGT